MSEISETLQEAVREAYASATSDIVVLHALEIWHRTFQVPARVVRWPVEGPDLTEFRCKLEDDAPRNAGETVTFLGVPYEIKLPEKSQDTPGEFEISISGAAEHIEPLLEGAALGGGEITCIYRSFIKGEENQGPTEIWPDIYLHSPSVDASTGTVTMKGSVLDWLNRKFGRLITPRAYPALVGRS